MKKKRKINSKILFLIILFIILIGLGIFILSLYGLYIGSVFYAESLVGDSEYTDHPDYDTVKVIEYNYEGKKISYLYDAWDIHLRSEMSLGIHKYFYEGDNLIKEELYDFEGNLEQYNLYIYERQFLKKKRSI